MSAVFGTRTLVMRVPPSIPNKFMSMLHLTLLLIVCQGTVLTAIVLSRREINRKSVEKREKLGGGCESVETVRRSIKTSVFIGFVNST